MDQIEALSWADATFLPVEISPWTSVISLLVLLRFCSATSAALLVLMLNVIGRSSRPFGDSFCAGRLWVKAFMVSVWLTAQRQTAARRGSAAAGEPFGLGG